MVSLEDRLFEAMKSHKNIVAIKDENREITYEELLSKALAIAGYLSSKKIINRNIGIIAQRGYAAYSGILGSIFSGCSYVPINNKYSQEKINDIIIQADVEVIIAERDNYKNVTCDRVRHIIFPDDVTDFVENPVSVITKKELYDIQKAPKPILIDSKENAYIIFTSGSTGKPKGVEVTRDNLLAFLINMQKYISLKPGYISAQIHELSFDFSVFQVFFPIITGGTISVVPKEEVYCPSDYIKRENVELWSSVPTIADIMNKFGVLSDNAFPKLKYSIFCGEPLSQQVANAWLGAAPNSYVQNYYGPTEATVFVTKYDYEKKDIKESYYNGIVPIGDVFDDHKILLIDENEKIVQDSNIGEIIVNGPQVAKGYLSDDERTKKSFISIKSADEVAVWYKTGDLAKYNEKHILEYVSRKDNQIKIAGRRVEIGEIESILRGAVKGYNATVIPVRNQNGIIQYLVAYVTIPLSVDDITEIRECCMEDIEDIFFPKKFIYIETIPTTTSGKVDRVKLESMANVRL